MISKDLTKIPFHYLRHGQTNGNKNNLLHGITDEPLNDEGIKQAQTIAKTLKNEEIFHIVSSPLKRALTTAEIVSKEIGKKITIVDELHELSFGELEGSENPNPIGFLKKWVEGKADTKYKIEEFEDFKKRISNGINKAFQIDQKPLLLVSHGIVYYALCDLLKIKYTDLNNCQHIFHDF